MLARVPARYLRRQEQANSVQYMEAWAELLEDELALQGRSSEVQTEAQSGHAAVAAVAVLEVPGTAR